MIEINLFKKYFVWTLIAVLVIEILSFIGHQVALLDWIVFFIIIIATFCLTLFQLKFGMLIALTELIIGSKGHLFSIDFLNFTVSIRMGLFAVIFLAWLITIFRQKNSRVFSNFSFVPLTAVFIIIVLNLINALANHNSLSFIFQDINAWFYFAYVGILLMR